MEAKGMPRMPIVDALDATKEDAQEDARDTTDWRAWTQLANRARREPVTLPSTDRSEGHQRHTEMGMKAEDTKPITTQHANPPREALTQAPAVPR